MSAGPEKPDGRQARHDGVDGAVRDAGVAGFGRVGVDLVVRVPGRADREDGHLLHVGRQVVVPDRRGPLLQGLEDPRHPQKGVERADDLAARQFELEAGRPGVGAPGRGQVVPQPGLLRVELGRFEQG